MCKQIKEPELSLNSLEPTADGKWTESAVEINICSECLDLFEANPEAFQDKLSSSMFKALKLCWNILAEDPTP